MYTESLYSSPNQKKVNQDLQKFKAIQEDLFEKTNHLTNYLLDYINEEDPAHNKSKIQSQLINQNKALKVQNNKLIAQKTYLQNYVKKLKKQLSSLKNGHEVSSENQHFDEQIDHIQVSDLPIKNGLAQIGCQNQKNLMNETQKMLEHAREQSVEDQYNVETMKTFLIIMLDKLIRKLNLSQIQQSFQGNQIAEEHNKIFVDKNVYGKLLQYYCDCTLIIKKSMGPSQGQFIENNKNMLIEMENSFKLLEKTNNLENIFYKMAKKNGYQNLWKVFLSKYQNESTKFKNRIVNILKDKNQFSRLNFKKDDSSKILSETLEQTRISQREQNFYEKLDQIIKYLDFDGEQKSFWIALNEKRKMNKLYNLDEILKKSKENSKTRKISEHLTVYFVKTMNQMFIRIFNLFEKRSSQRSLNPEELLGPKIAKQLSRIQQKTKQNLIDYISLDLDSLISENNSEQKSKNSKRELQLYLVKAIEQYIKIFQNNFYLYHQPISLQII